jgi:DNA-directed RNA polymerase subunit RPC12/RpoP
MSYTRQPVMNPDCAGGCGRSIIDAAEECDPTVWPPGWSATENPRGYIRVRCPDCGGRTGYMWCRRCDISTVVTAGTSGEGTVTLTEDESGHLHMRCPRCGGETG